MKVISKRCQIPYTRIRKIINEQLQDPITAFQKYKPRKKFKKIHPHIHKKIMDVLQNSTSMVTVPYLNQQLKKEFGTNIKNKMLRLYLKNEIGASFKHIKQITCNHNTIDSKLQRQFAASCYINFLYEGKTIINIDESSFSMSDARKKCWLIGNSKNKQTHSVRLNGINIIAAVTSKGDALFTINNGITNSYTILFFILKLIDYLEAQDKNWRIKSIIMLDNARYHKSKLMHRVISDLNIPIMFLGPYHYKMAPIEIFFAYIKNRDLNTLKTRNVKEHQERLIREIALHIGKVQTQWIESSFIYVLQSALESLCLTPL